MDVGVDYILQPFDLLKIEVFQEPDLERQLRVSQESTVTLPLIGTISLKDKTIRQAQDQIRTLYDRDYLVNPQINLTVMEFAKRLVSVLGAVNTATSVPIPPDQKLTLLDAIAGAGGFSRVADRRHVKLTRANEDGKSVTFDINADDIIKSTAHDTWELRKNDVIYVPERVM